ncbi:MAG: arginine--tRNA ligase, partial [Deltaproteobacteria bacterium]|nr:arginine--tRNA ligase [Deltaproteobacteria bacterium]
QYAHARVASIKRKATEMGLALPAPGEADLGLLSEPEELALLRNLAAYPDLIAQATQSLEPHRLTYYLTQLASAFHAYYNRHRVLGQEPELSRARLCLAQAVGQVVANGLGILGVEAPERMEREPDEDGR